jgi:hypothetical protein
VNELESELEAGLDSGLIARDWMNSVTEESCLTPGTVPWPCLTRWPGGSCIDIFRCATGAGESLTGLPKEFSCIIRGDVIWAVIDGNNGNCTKLIVSIWLSRE